MYCNCTLQNNILVNTTNDFKKLLINRDHYEQMYSVNDIFSSYFELQYDLLLF